MLQEIWSQIVQYDKIIIHRHVSPDPDAIGSQVGLATIIKHNYPEKWVRTVGFKEPSLLWMGQMDDVFDEEYEGALILIMDTANASRIDDNRYPLGSMTIKIDHHPNVDEYADFNYTDTLAAATCEIVVQLFEANKHNHHLELPIEAAELLYAGIISDSGRFLYDSTTISTLQCAMLLYDYQVNRSKVHGLLYKRALNIVQAEGHVLSHFKTTSKGVAYYMMSKAEQKSFQLTTGTRASLVNLLANIEGIRVWVSFFENEDGQIRANIRSNGPTINDVAANFNGGGHPQASGAMLSSWDECAAVVEALNEVASKDE